jgi:ABC-type bacteriocin/lantibiotic exporter with double-glycine peptidase domain
MMFKKFRTIICLILQVKIKVIKTVNTEIENKKIPVFNILKKISHRLDDKRKKDVKVVFFLSILSSIAESISIAMLVPFISFFVSPDNYIFNYFFENFFNLLSITSQKDILTIVSFSFVLIVLLSSFIKLQYVKSSNELTDNITSDFRIKIFKFLINQDFSYYFKHGSNEILSNLSQKTGSFTVIIFSAINIINSILISLAVVTILIINEPLYTPLIITSILLFFFIIFKIKSTSVLKKGQTINLNQNFMIDIFQNTVGYLPEIIIYNLKNFFLKTLGKVSKETAKSGAEVRTISMSPKIYLETFIIIFVVLVVYFSDLGERSIESNISYLAILAFGTQKCLPLLNNIYSLSINYKASVPTVTSFLNILDTEKMNVIKDPGYESLKFENKIKLDNLTFKYNKNSANIINKFSFDIVKGEKIVIKGQTGSGKSTLTNIISGLLTPSDGRILIDGTLINSENVKNWQKNIAIVPQTVFLNDATILENIAIALDVNAIDFKKVKNSAKIAQIDSFIESLPNKYNEKVGERGVRLSGGQRQRVGIARALYRDAKVIILDEPTNALDTETEKLVMDSISRLGKDITLIMISHSDSSLKYFDKIIDLDKFK